MDDPGRVRSQIALASIVRQIQRFDFDRNLVLEYHVLPCRSSDAKSNTNNTYGLLSLLNLVRSKPMGRLPRGRRCRSRFNHTLTAVAPLIAMLLASHVGHGLGFVHRFVGPSTLMDPKFSSVGRRAVVIRTW